MGITLGVIKKSGSWFSYNGERVAQGKDNTRAVFENSPELMADLEAKVRSMSDKLDKISDEFELDDDDDIDTFDIKTIGNDED